MLLTLRHYALRTYLASKVLLCGKELAIVTEEYTSKTCGRCGHIKENLGGAKVCKCQECGFKCDRDANGARNILLKHLCEPQEVQLLRVAHAFVSTSCPCLLRVEWSFRETQTETTFAQN
ncbi:putative IS605 transposase [Chloropicon primus]|nr:putative IS605 transposase [Chloropicon primus]